MFLVGCGRSGTTLLYDMLAVHPDLAWFSSFTQRWPALPQLAALSRLHALTSLRASGGRWVPRPREGHAIWDAARPDPRPGDNGPLTAADAAPGDVACMRATAAAHARYHGRPRFMNKNTRNARRVGFLDAAFPDAVFVHVVRDPRATVASLLKVAFWPDLPIWWVGDRNPRELVAEGWDEAALGAELWSREVDRALGDLASIDPRRSLTVTYEDLAADPAPEVLRVLDLAELPVTSRFMATLDEHGAASRNAKFRTELDDRQISTIEVTAGPVAARLGYELP